MPKITDFAPKIFGSAAGVNQIAQFGSLFAGTPAFTTNPAVAQALGNYLTGWLGAAIGGNSPAVEDMNAPFFVITTMLAILREVGVGEWNAGINYFKGSVVNFGGEFFVSLTDDNLANAITDTANWKRFDGGLVQNTLDYALLLTDEMVEFDATLGVTNATLPAANSAGCKGKKFTITKTDATANAVVVSDGTYTVNLVAQYDSVTVFSNGGVWYAI